MVKRFFERRYVPALVATTLLGMLINAWSVLRALADASFHGLLPYGGSEEAMYLIRAQEALHAPFTNVTNGIWSGQYAPLGLQSAGVEQLFGALFFWTGLSAPWLVFGLHVLLAPLTIPLAAALMRRVGATKPLALFCGVLLFWYFVYCRRLFHPGFSLPLVLGTLLLLWRWYEKPTVQRTIALGLPLGYSVGVYLWSWTFLWATTGLLVLATLADRTSPQRGTLLKSLPWLSGTTLLAAAPALKHLAMARLLPFFGEASVRAGLVHTHMPESLARSVLTVLLFCAAAWIFRKKEERRTMLPLLAMLGALAVAYNQQLVHGVVMSFSSHYIHYVSVIATMLVVAMCAHGKRDAVALLTLLVCTGLLVLNFKDMGGRWIAFLPPPPEAMRMQHLSGAVEKLGAMPKTLLLSDKNASDIVASYTHHDVVFTEYSGFLLIPDKEYAERACVAEVFAPQPVDYTRLVVHAEEQLRVLRGQETQAEYDASLAAANAACAAVRADPVGTLKRYGITTVLWDEYGRPSWKLNKSFLKLTQAGNGWSLWEVQF